MQPTPDQMNDAANTVLFMIGAIVLVVGIGGGWLLWQWEKRAAYVEEREAQAYDQPRSAAFTETRTNGSTAFTSDGTERTDVAGSEPRVQIDKLEGPDLQVIVAALERRGYLCLTALEQETVRKLVYQVERRARLTPASERSKSEAIERATGYRRGGSAKYERASAIYDAVVGKPDPAVVSNGNLPQQEAVTA